MKYQELQHFYQIDFQFLPLANQLRALASLHLPILQLLQQLPLDHSIDKNVDKLECNGHLLQFLVGEYGCKAAS